MSRFIMDHGKEGSKRIELVGIDDKRQLTAVFAGTLVRDFLPIQLVYKGKMLAYDYQVSFRLESFIFCQSLVE